MSHTTVIRSVEIKNINALKAAVQELIDSGIKCELVENAKPRMYYDNQHGICPYVLKLHGTKYDVGFEKHGDNYLPVFDVHAGYVMSQIGNKSNKFLIHIIFFVGIQWFGINN